MADPSMTPAQVSKVSKTPSPLTNGTWVLVADGEKALLLENIGDAERPVLELRREDFQDNPKNRDQGSAKPGRRGGSSGAVRSAIEETDWHRLAETRFAADLADILFKRAGRHRFKRLIVAAGPRLLGDLRPKLHQEVSDRIVAEVPLTLTNHPVDEMARRIADHLTQDAGLPDA